MSKIFLSKFVVNKKEGPKTQIRKRNCDKALGGETWEEESEWRKEDHDSETRRVTSLSLMLCCNKVLICHNKIQKSVSAFHVLFLSWQLLIGQVISFICGLPPPKTLVLHFLCLSTLWSIPLSFVNLSLSMYFSCVKIPFYSFIYY